MIFQLVPFTDRPTRGKCPLSLVLYHLRKGDRLIVWRLDRLGRSVKDLVALINELRELTVAEIASQYGVSPATIYRRFSDSVRSKAPMTGHYI